MTNGANGNNISLEDQKDHFREMFEYITNYCTDKLVEYQTADDWENNDNTISWLVPETDWVARLTMEPLSARDGCWHVAIGVHRRNSDRLRSYFLKKGSRQELIEYLKRPETRAEFMDSILELYKDE